MFYYFLLLGEANWHIPILLGLIIVFGLYLFLLRNINSIVFYKQPLLFMLTLTLLFFTIGSPLSTLSHLSFSFHMIQMSILYFIVPPLVLLGIPYPMYKQVMNISMIKRRCRLCLPPKIVLLVFATLFTMYHLPVILNVFSNNAFIQNSYLLLMFLLSFGIWWPILSPDPKQRLTKKQMKKFGFYSGLALMPACMIFILNAMSDELNNPFLTQAIANLCIPNQSNSFSLLTPPFNTKLDQLMAGIIMLGIHKFSIMTFIFLESRILCRKRITKVIKKMEAL